MATRLNTATGRPVQRQNLAQNPNAAPAVGQPGTGQPVVGQPVSSNGQIMPPVVIPGPIDDPIDGPIPGPILPESPCPEILPPCDSADFDLENKCIETVQEIDVETRVKVGVTVELAKVDLFAESYCVGTNGSYKHIKN